MTTAFSKIKAFIDANWSALPVVYPNRSYNTADTPAGFMLVEVTGNMYAQASIGAGTRSNNLFRESGLLWAHFMVQSGTGSEQAHEYALAFVKLLMAGSVSDLRFDEASIGLGEPGEENGNYWRLSVSLSWQQDNP